MVDKNDKKQLDLTPDPLPKGKGSNENNPSPMSWAKIARTFSPLFVFHSPLTHHDSRITTHTSRFTLHASLVLITFLIYLNSLPNEFIFDDVPLVQNSLNVLNGGFWDLVSSYRPIRYLTYAFDYHIFGMHPWGFRLMNIFYHALTVLSLFWMLKVFGLSKKAAFISALIFAIHPVHTDAVAYISGRRDVLMGLFYVLSVGSFMKFYNSIGNAGGKRQSRVESDQGSRVNVENSTLPHLHNSTGRPVLPLFLSLLFLFLSISSKEMGATIPLIFILYIFYKDGAKLFKKRWFYIAMMSLLLLFSFFVFFAISSGGSGLVSLDGVHFHGNSPEVHYLTASTIWLHYLKLAVFPLKLILDNANYPLVLEWNFKVFFSVLSIFVYGWVVWRIITLPRPLSFKKEGMAEGRSPLTTYASRLTSHAPAIAFWMIFFVISLGPVLQIIPLHEIVAVHYLYVPVIGFCVIVGILFERFVGATFMTPKKKGKSIQGAINLVPTILLILLLTFFSIRTITRNFELKDIWTAIHADEKWGPLSFRGYFTLGAQYVDMKFPDRAAEYYDKALVTGAWDGNLLGNIIGFHILKGDHASAFKFYEKMVKRGEYLIPSGTLNMAVLYMLNGNCEKAVQLANSFSPLANQIKRVELVKKCNTYEFDKFDNTEISDIYHKQELMKVLGLEVERKPYLGLLVAAVKREDVKSEEKESLSLHASRLTLHASRFTTPELLDLIHELAVVNLQSDIPEAIKYYKMERDLYRKMNESVPEIITKSIAVLEDYQHKVLVEGKYYKLEW